MTDLMKLMGIGMFIIASFFMFFFALNSFGIIGQTMVEREVYKESYQRTAGLDAKLATLEAQKAEIEVQLQNAELTDNTRNNLEAQLASINVQINTVKTQKSE